MHLAEGASLGVGDVLALLKVPELVVLSGCETAKVEAGGIGLGLGQAFVIAGAEAVIAATRPVDDRETERLMMAFYASKAEGAPARLRDAQLSLAREGGVDWAAFRVLVP